VLKEVRVTRHRDFYKGQDPRTREAKAQGYPARSVFKLHEIDARVGLLRAGQHVLDLGAAPGSWSLYASEKVGPKGLVLAVDLQEITQTFAANVVVVRGDALSLEQHELARFAPYDVVLSDMAPSTSGSKIRDQAQSFELFMRALEVANALSKPGGAFVGKLFMGPDFPAAKQAMASAYADVRVIRPTGTRKPSSEVFLVGTRRKA
jgi:23S rRNA (uridine2552-2'-O)-methyltransferase